MVLTPELLWQAGLSLAACGAVYGGIRADLRTMHAAIQSVKEDADEAHRRLDRHLEAPARR